jgi:hypothetical protein
MSRIKSIPLALYLAIFILAACASPPPLPPTEAPVLPSETPIPPTNTLLPTSTSTQTPLPPTDTPTVEPTVTYTPVDTETPTSTVTATRPVQVIGPGLMGATSDTVSIYFIEPGASGSCSGRIIGVSSGVKISGDIEEDVYNGLAKLLSYKAQWYGTLNNPLYASSMRVKKVDFDSSTGAIEVFLAGTYKPSGDPCDNTRVRDQVWTTIRQFRGVKSTIVFLNKLLLGDRLSNDN